jgi:hypothetical protein
MYERPILQRPPVPPVRAPGVLLVVEGLNDIEFLLRMSRILHAHGASVPDLADLERLGRLVFVPVGGENLQHWSKRLGALGWREFHLYDREVAPETEIRHQAAFAVNARPDCRAVVMQKRSLENYLHPLAIEEAKGFQVRFSDLDPVADIVARLCLPVDCHWDELSRRAKNRLRYRIKKWLNRDAVDRMTPARLAEQDLSGELMSWLSVVAALAS